MKIKRASGHKQQGLTLVEMMVAMTIGLVLLGGVVTVLLSSKNTYRVNESLARMQENARYAFQILSRDIRMAGYRGCAGGSTTVVNTLNQADEFLWRFDFPLEGYEAKGESGWEPELDVAITSPVEGSDVLVIRGIEVGDEASGISVTNSAMVVSHLVDVASPGSKDITISTGGSFKTGSVVQISDCYTAAVFHVTAIYAAGGGFASLVHLQGGVSPGNATAVLGKEYATGGEVVPVSTRAYFVRNNPNGIPALYIKKGTSNSEELVEGIDEMQIRYGMDLNGDQSADVYWTANQIADAGGGAVRDCGTEIACRWGAVVSVRIDLLVQSIEDEIASQSQNYFFDGESKTATDRRLRQSFSTVISLRNRTS